MLGLSIRLCKCRVISQESEQLCICVVGLYQESEQLCICVRVIDQESEQLCICVLGLSIRKVSSYVYVW